MVFYFYDTLQWTTIRFGIVIGVYGIAMVFGQVVLAGVSDRFGRIPVILAGIVLSSTIFFGLATLTSFAIILAVCLVSGLGTAFIAPARSAFYLDIAAEAHRSRVVGIKESASAIGGAAGPALVALLTAIFLRPPAPARDVAVGTESSGQRSMPAGATLRGLVLSARSARGRRLPV